MRMCNDPQSHLVWYCLIWAWARTVLFLGFALKILILLGDGVIPYKSRPISIHKWCGIALLTIILVLRLNGLMIVTITSFYGAQHPRWPYFQLGICCDTLCNDPHIHLVWYCLLWVWVRKILLLGFTLKSLILLRSGVIPYKPRPLSILRLCGTVQLTVFIALCLKELMVITNGWNPRAKL